MKVYLIGAGPGDPGLLTLKGKAALEQADVVIYDYLASDLLLSMARPEAERIYVGKKAGDHALPQQEINALLVAKAQEGKVVARLKGGDPYIFGRGGEEAVALVAANIPFEEIPGISSTIAGPAYAGIPLTHRGLASSVTLITGHEDPTKPGSVHNWSALAQSANTLVFVMGMKNLPDIAANLISAGMDPKTPAALVHWGTTPQHRSLVGSLESLPQDALREGFTNPSVIVIGKVVGLRDTLNWFEQKPLLGRSVVVTRAREQASGLAQTLTDLGADVVLFPTIAIKPLVDEASLRAIQRRINTITSYDWLIFTSVNGVHCFWARLAELGHDTRVLGNRKVAAIGPATANALRAQGLEPDFIPEEYMAEGIVEGLLRGKHADVRLEQGQRVLLIRAKEAREVLPEELAKAGAFVDVLPVYETLPVTDLREEVRDRLVHKRIDCVTFGSSSTVHNFFAQIEPELLQNSPTRMASIGPITADTLKGYGFTPHIMPEKYTIPALVKAIVAYFEQASTSVDALPK